LEWFASAERAHNKRQVPPEHIHHPVDPSVALAKGSWSKPLPSVVVRNQKKKRIRQSSILSKSDQNRMAKGAITNGETVRKEERKSSVSFRIIYFLAHRKLVFPLGYKISNHGLSIGVQTSSNHTLSSQSCTS
jgi:hypothetical protein